MKILVPVKKVLDYEAKIKVKADGSGIETDGIKMILNPFDEIAVEEALKLKEAGKCEEVIVASIGADDCSNQLRYAMAMGADRAILVKSDSYIDSDAAARVFVELVKKEAIGLVIMGKQAIDSDASQTPQLLATYLNWPQASFASKVQLESDHVLVTREVDGGLETIRCTLPAVISTDLRLNQPRYASLPGIMKAKKKPLDEIDAASMGLDLSAKVKVLKMHPPAARKGGRKVADVAELVAALKNEAKVL
jgi:electron transfer flavoprotein beta subunit